MSNWHVFSTVDMVHGKDHGVIFSLNDIRWANKHVWGVMRRHGGRNASTRYLFPSVLVRVKFALMTRLARMVVSGLPHHVTQRGNRREPIFFEDGDQEIYRDLLGEQAHHRSDEPSTGNSFMGCSPAEPKSASPVLQRFSPNPTAVRPSESSDILFHLAGVNKYRRPRAVGRSFSGTDGISPNAKRPVLSFFGMDSAGVSWTGLSPCGNRGALRFECECRKGHCSQRRC
jgi:hypothetical protein